METKVIQIRQQRKLIDYMNCQTVGDPYFCELGTVNTGNKSVKDSLETIYHLCNAAHWVEGYKDGMEVSDGDVTFTPEEAHVGTVNGDFYVYDPVENKYHVCRFVGWETVSTEDEARNMLMYNSTIWSYDDII